MNNDPKVKSLFNAMNVLDLVNSYMPVGVTVLSEKTGLSKSTVSKILATFQDSEYVIQHDVDRTFSIGPGIIRMGVHAHEKLNLHSVSHQVMQELTRKYDENTMIMIEQQLKAVVIDVCKAQNPNRLSVRLGYQYALYRGAAPKVLLAFLPEEKKEQVIAMADWLPITPKTITEERVLRERLELIRSNRYEMSLGEFDPGTMAYAVPIFDAFGHVLASLAISGETSRMEQHDKEEIIGTLKVSAQKISRSLGASEEFLKMLD